MATPRVVFMSFGLLLLLGPLQTFGIRLKKHELGKETKTEGCNAKNNGNTEAACMGWCFKERTECGNENTYATWVKRCTWKPCSKCGECSGEGGGGESHPMVAACQEKQDGDTCQVIVFEGEENEETLSGTCKGEDTNRRAEEKKKDGEDSSPNHCNIETMPQFVKAPCKGKQEGDDCQITDPFSGATLSGKCTEPDMLHCQPEEWAN